MKGKKEIDPLWALFGMYIAFLFLLFVLGFGFNMLYTIWKGLLS